MSARPILWATAVAMMCLFAQSARAEEDLGFRTIWDIGCGAADGQCWASLSGDGFGTKEKCREGKPLSNEVRWDNGDQPNGQRMFAALYAAFLAGRSVQIVTNGCSNNGAPTVWWYHIR